MERLTERTADGILVKENHSENGIRTFYQCIGGKPNANYSNCEEGYCAMEKLAAYEDADEKGMILSAPLDGVESFSLDGKTTWFKAPCKVGDVAYLIDRDEDNKLKVYEGKWERVSLVQTSKDGSFELCGEISYDIRDCFYNDGRTMKHGMYVGQESTKIGEVVFLTKEAAEAKLKEMEMRIMSGRV